MHFSCTMFCHSQGGLYASAAAGAADTAHTLGLSHCAQGHRPIQNAHGFAVEARKLPTACQSRNFSSKRKQQLLFVLYHHRAVQRDQADKSLDTTHREMDHK